LIIAALAAGASFLPGMPRLELGSELILAIVVPPLLYSATRGASISSFGANLRPTLNLGVLLVLLTTAALGLVTSWLIPSLGLAAAFVLGAVLAPPDTITRVSHGDEIALPIEDIDMRQAARHTLDAGGNPGATSTGTAIGSGA
jgi:CPA1 family monovalent cation:H+ antiporter